MKGKFVSYLRVSTQRQGKSGLGVEAQREAVTGYLNGGSHDLIKEFVEVESGKRSDRPELAKALALCRLRKAVLIIARLDRLSRNVAFISSLMEAGVKFVAVDLPQANELTVHILAAMAEYEAKAISARTKAALAAAKVRGTVLGGLRWDITKVASNGRAQSLKSRQESASKYQSDVGPIIAEKLRSGKWSFRRVAAALNEEGTPAPRGGTWSGVQVQRVMRGYSDKVLVSANR